MILNKIEEKDKKIKRVQKIHCIIARGESWYEDFVDEDNGDVVTIKRFQSKEYHLAVLDVHSNLQSRKGMGEFLWSYFNENFDDTQIMCLLTKTKYDECLDGKANTRIRKQYPDLKISEPYNWMVNPIVKEKKKLNTPLKQSKKKK